MQEPRNLTLLKGSPVSHVVQDVTKPLNTDQAPCEWLSGWPSSKSLTLKMDEEGSLIDTASGRPYGYSSSTKRGSIKFVPGQVLSL